ncbi:septal ring lytic transglycosylase RlpA family protein [Sphingomonas fennica]|uniref:Endolytic peptidoglycan transglycosylase RlpA n=1 Tax=Edaphosphingomonas fennica TaxID=114404 RepID=A0A2T4I4P7_9SPHN|nr:septal ring lytic transglycosylase RlpA family protein [Sphingomonas fennica]PTD24477.1 septal ring lytic transglycosylase RlpA family lipoprotein [Sphingomonas fennica]
MKWRAELAVLAAAGLLSACASTRPVSDGAVKIGKPYVVGGRTYVPRDDRNYDQTGLASWYGPGHHGRKTANGERFDMNAISAAHPTLPMPSYAEVTALATGRTILVRINDRGPFAPGRIIDLSRGAARALGVEKDGVVRVRVRRVYPSDKRRASLGAQRSAY